VGDLPAGALAAAVPDDLPNRAAHRALAAAPGAPAIGFLDFLAQHETLGRRIDPLVVAGFEVFEV